MPQVGQEQSSIFYAIRSLVTKFADDHRVNASPSLFTLSQRFYESLLIASKGPFRIYKPGDNFCQTVLFTSLKLVGNQAQVDADLLERLFDAFAGQGVNLDDAINILEFFSSLFLLTASNGKVSSGTGFFDRKDLAPISLSTSLTKFFSGRSNSSVGHLFFDHHLKSDEFPTLPDFDFHKDQDEGFEDFGDAGDWKPIRCSNSDNHANECPLCEKPSLDRKIKSVLDVHYVTQIQPAEFHRYYLTNFLLPVCEWSKQDPAFQQIPTAPQVVSDRDLIQSVKYLVFGIASNVFSLDKDERKFAIRENICLLGYTVETVFWVLEWIIELGSNLLYIEDFLRSIAECNSVLLRQFRISLAETCRAIKQELNADCDVLLNDGLSLLRFKEVLSPYCLKIKVLQTFIACLNETCTCSENGLPVIHLVMNAIYSFYDAICLLGDSSNAQLYALFTVVLDSYFEFVELWVADGFILKSNDDFFVSFNEQFATCYGRQFWTKRFTLESDRVPNFLKQHAQLLFNAGRMTTLDKHMKVETSLTVVQEEERQDRSLCFLADNRPCIGTPVSPLSILIPSTHPIKRTIEDRVTKIKGQNQTVGNFTRFFINDCKLLDGLKLLRELYLGANGFFLSSLASRLFPELNDVVTQISWSSGPAAFCPAIFNNILDDNIDLLNEHPGNFGQISFIFDSQKLESLSVLCNNNDGATSQFVDVFELHCEISWPYNLVVTETGHEWMKKVFKFLLAMRWAAWSLAETWIFLTSLKNGDHFQNIHQLLLQQREMTHFFQQLEIYVLHQTVDVCWADLRRNLSTCKGMDEIFGAHAKYVNEVALRCLLTPKAQPIFKSIHKLLDCALHFHRAVVQCENEQRALDVFANFSARSKGFVTVVEKLASRVYQPHLNELLVRLNFNGYYY